jgi:hypothetical protein
MPQRAITSLLWLRSGCGQVAEQDPQDQQWGSHYKSGTSFGERKAERDRCAALRTLTKRQPGMLLAKQSGGARDGFETKWISPSITRWSKVEVKRS